MAVYDGRACTSRGDVSSAFALVLIIAMLSTLVLDAYAFSIFVGA